MADLFPFTPAIFSRNELTVNIHILDGTFFELLPEKSTFTQPVGRCVKCKPAEVEIKGHERSSSNFLCHLRRVHGEQAVKEYRSHLEQMRRSKRDASSLVRTALMKDSKAAATSYRPLPIATTCQSSKRKADEEVYSRVSTSNQDFAGSGSESDSAQTTSSVNSHEECDAMSMLWVSKLKKLDEVQRIVAENLITQVLTKAYFKELTRNIEICDVDSCKMESNVSGSDR